jgi:hypothetical protein
MKRVLLAAAILALAVSAFQKAEARVDLSIDFFYDNLGDGGSWVEVGDYGYCWQPTIAVSNTSWRPYTDGYWAYTDQGWTWISYEDFGWATYHYGRWIRLRGRGWVWVPGREWGPAWVSWRAGGDYVGWAPLPPRRAGEYWDETPITARVDIDFDIGPAYYNFIDVRYIGEPVLRERIYAPEQNITYITKTVNVTNITYNNSTVYNYGPDYNTLSRYSARPIQRLSLQRETNIDPATAAKSKSIMKIEGDKLMVAAPQQFQKPTKPAAPKVVKEKIAQAPVERGWEPVAGQKAQAELKEKIKKEDPKSVPPPTMQASDKAAISPGASMTPPATGVTSTTPSTSAAAASTPGKNKNKRTPKVEPIAPTVAPKSSKEKTDKHKYEVVVPPPAAPRVAPPMTPPDNRPNMSGPDSTKAESAVEKPKHERPADIAPPSTRDEGGKKQKKNEPAAAPTP